MSDRKPMRVVFGETLVELGAEDERIVVLDADVSSSTQTKLFAAACPDRFFNFGVAEANMVSAAAGFAACGMVPFVSTFALFVSLRAGDQVRSQIAYTGLNVKLVGGYAGLSDYADGASHQSVEDIAVLRAIPNFAILSPSDRGQTKQAVRAAAAHDGPVFLRISRQPVGELHPADTPFEIGKSLQLRDGSDVALIAAGPVLESVLAAAERLADEGVQARVIDMHTIKPLDCEAVVRAASETGALVTVEEHNVFGGLGSAVCEAVCAAQPVPVRRVGIPDRFGESGEYSEILERAGLSPGSIAAAARQAIQAKAG